MQFYPIMSFSKIKNLWQSKFFRLAFFLSIALLFYLGFELSIYIFRYRYENALNQETERILNKLSRKQLLGQVIHLSVPGKDASNIAIYNELKEIEPGGVILFGYNIESAERLAVFNKKLQSLADELDIPSLLISTDQEGGRVIRVPEPVTQFPSALAIGQADNAALAKWAGFQLARQLRRIGINLFFAPVLDINNNPQNPVIGLRSFGSDPDRVIRNALAFEKGAREGGSMPVVKHFPGHGNTNVDSHFGLPVIESTQKELENFELLPFKAAIENGVDAIMSAHILFPSLDNEYPATLSQKILKEILRKKLDFKGLIFTDAMEMKAIASHYRDKRAGVRALLAGADILLLTSWGKEPKKYLEEITRADKAGEFFVEGKDIIKEAVRRQIKLKLRYGIFSGKWTTHEILVQKEIQKNKNRQKADALLQANYNELNKTLSREAVKTLVSPKDFPLPDKCDMKIFSKSIRTQIKPIKKEDSDDCKIIETPSAGALRQLNQRAKKNPKVKFFALYARNPFEYKPDAKNLQVLYSFSPTKESLAALGYALQKNVYRKINRVQLQLP